MRAIALSVSAAAVAVIASAWACLPDLVLAPSASLAGTVCGDGVITPFLADGGAGEECDPGPDDAGTQARFCASCRVVCAGGYGATLDPSSGHCYFGAGGSSAIDAAAAACEEIGSHVVRFVSKEEVAFVARVPTEAPYWVGLKESGANKPPWLPTEPTNEPGWSDQCPGCFAAIDASATSIPAGDGLTEIGTCVVVPSLGTSPGWTQSLCVPGKQDGGTLSRYTMCEREPLGTRTFACPGGACFTVAATQASKQYEIVAERLAANDAVTRCTTLGGALVTFTSGEEREQVGYEIGTEIALAAGTTDVWIGLSSTDGATWRWDSTDAGGLDPPPWAATQPIETSSAGRAYVVVQAGSPYSELASVDASGSHFPLCEIAR